MLENEKYEARYLLGIISSVINQTEMPRTVRNLRWEYVYRLADYHNVANVVYYGVLGLEKDISDKWKNKFYEKYQEVLLIQERFRSAEEVLMWQMEKNQIHAMFLKDSVLCRCYEPREIRSLKAVNLLVEKEKSLAIHAFMKDMDYGLMENRRNKGLIYYRIPRTTVMYQTDLGLNTKDMKKYFDFPIKSVSRSQGKKYIHELTEDEFFVYFLSDLVYQYASGNIDICGMMDLWTYYKKYGEALDWIYIKKELKKINISTFSHHLLYLSYLWFGEESDKVGNTGLVGRELNPVQKEEGDWSQGLYSESEIYNAMEEYILTKGKDGREVSSTLLPLIKEVLDFYVRDRRKEWFHKKFEFIFPDREYMEKMYPGLRKKRFLLPFYWMKRLTFFQWQLFRQWIHKRMNPVREWLSGKRKTVSEEDKEPLAYQYQEKSSKVRGKSRAAAPDKRNRELDREKPYMQSKKRTEMDAAEETSGKIENISISDELKSLCPSIALGILKFTVSVGECSPELLQMIENATEKVKKEYQLTEISSIPHIQSTRKGYQALGKSPHEFRNTAEALLRKIMEDGNPPPANNIQGINQLMSISSGYSISTYDRDKIEGDVKYVRAGAGSYYKDKGGDKKLSNIEFLPSLCDEKGCFGTPTLDSHRTALQYGSREVITAIYSFDGIEGLKEWIGEYEFLLSLCCEIDDLEVQCLPV